MTESAELEDLVRRAQRGDRGAFAELFRRHRSDVARLVFRMLGPTEHLRAQRFWEGYDTSAANKSETTKGAGNAVAVNVAHWIGAEVAEALHAA